MGNRIYVQVEVDLDEVLGGSDPSDVIEWLLDKNELDDYIHKDDIEEGSLVDIDKDSVDGGRWNEAILKLVNRKMLLTSQQENIIMAIADKIV